MFHLMICLMNIVSNQMDSDKSKVEWYIDWDYMYTRHPDERKYSKYHKILFTKYSLILKKIHNNDKSGGSNKGPILDSLI